MAHLSGISAGLFSAIAVTTVSTNITRFDSRSAANFATIFSDRDSSTSADAVTAAALPWALVPNVREFPSFGTPANIVNVPNFGQSTSSQIQAQADAPNIEVVFNYDPTTWTATGGLSSLVGNGNNYYVALHLLASEPTAGTGDDKYQTLSANIGTVGNTSTYFMGKLEALSVAPSLSDATQATLTISVQSSFEGPFTV